MEVHRTQCVYECSVRPGAMRSLRVPYILPSSTRTHDLLGAGTADPINSGAPHPHGSRLESLHHTAFRATAAAKFAPLDIPLTINPLLWCMECLRAKR